MIVHCSFSPPVRAKPILLKCGAPLKHGGISCGDLCVVSYHPRLIHRAANSQVNAVTSHSVVTLTFEAPVLLKRGYGYYFYLVPIRGLGSYFHDHSHQWEMKGEEKGLKEELKGEEKEESKESKEERKELKAEREEHKHTAWTDGESLYTPPVILSEECTVNATVLTIPLPQLDSSIQYGLKMSLPGMVVDALANTALLEQEYDNGYLFRFTSSTGESNCGGVRGRDAANLREDGGACGCPQRLAE